MLLKKIEHQISDLDETSVSTARKNTLQLLINYIQSKVDSKQVICLNFICTHNSRRSHLSQAWAQALAYYFNIKNVFCYSGGTETTALFPMAAKTLENTGFDIQTITDGSNPIYAIKYSDNEHPIIGYSKKFDNKFNPKSDFAAILTCSSADQDCPFIAGAEVRIPITFEDPKAFDHTPQQTKKYQERSLQIATDLKYVFSKIKL
ncbi:arsenate reductase [Formosa sp. Hel3_A1_48]|uniref:protein-tyrosine-phosphatase n=1 Tax=Formosa sp. Hel3_A1_48 TaxID=1336795 RepID=UPI00084E31FC|nr:protein-tyrosine-phosphatase [Formosa sp. Hel3_A1_48]AOR26490.1 arsenate reductase [Formosa sp. Hel3_A1_48]MDC0950764.1 protein-tyrosine-phosphatase [Flavobacteriaceae bacterium]